MAEVMLSIVHVLGAEDDDVLVEMAHREDTAPTSLGERPTPRRTSLLEELFVRMAWNWGRIDASKVVRSEAARVSAVTVVDVDDEVLLLSLLRSEAMAIRTPVVVATDPPNSECADTKFEAKA